MDNKEKFSKYYRLSEEDGSVRLETVYLDEAQRFLKNEFDTTGKILNMEIVNR